jgi:phytol kinase
LNLSKWVNIATGAINSLPLELHLNALISQNLFQETIIGLIIFVYVLGVVYGTRLTYNLFMKRNVPPNVAKYYNRKLIHIFAGGVPTLLFPILFSAVTIPLVLVSLLALITYIPHKVGKLFYWFQVKENMFEVNFVIAWGFAIGLSWIITGSPIYGVIPAAFMSFGDAATGVLRNLVYKRRTKSWLGNIAMVIVCIPIGYYYAMWAGVVAAIIASVIEHFEFGPIDDNILITVASFLTLLVLMPVA